ncbi:maltose acetyltransferase domain-containing protein [Lachnospiraceae bacterium 62-26]
MTEQEKMKNGYLWNDDEENMALQAQAKKFVRQFNALPPEDMDGRVALLPKLFGVDCATAYGCGW